MADLVATGPDPDNGWRRTLPAGPVTLGRLAAKSAWDAPWDKQISSLHATLTWRDGRLWVRKEPRAVNKIYFQGEPAEDFSLGVGEQFVIGATTFSLHASEPVGVGPSPLPALSELTCSRQELAKVRYVDADERVEILAALPGIIRYSPSDAELEGRVVDVLLRGIPRAAAAAVVWLDPASPAADPVILVRCAGRRDGTKGELHPSRRLVSTAVCRRRQSVLHTWGAGTRGDFTVSPGFDWAICAPLPDDPCPGWALYVTGHLQGQALPAAGPPLEALQKGDLKFAELVADVFGALRQVRDLKSRQLTLARMLSPTVLAALAEGNVDEVLRPRPTEVTVLFCDLRGSCRITEEAEQELPDVCKRVEEALTIMTGEIIDKDGVIGDFHGDAAMGFWGWPLDNADQVERAARTALAIRREFQRVSAKAGHALAGFACGLGIANGPAIAGKLGTLDQLKISVFGPVVNLAARLESMTKVFRVPILVDERCAARLNRPGNSHWARCRRLAKVRPYGMSKGLLVSELLPPAVEPGAMSEPDRRDYEAALDAFLAGQWADARNLLERLPDADDAFLRQFMDRHGPAPPAEWDGVIALEAK